MPAKRLRFCRLSLASPTRLSSKPPVMAIAGLKENKYFPNPPADPATLEAKLVEFIEAITAANQGGKHDKLFKSKKREELLVLLRQDAMYVQTHCNDDIEKLMSSGFLPVSTNRTSSPISTPVITSLEQDNGGQLVAAVKKIRNVRSHHLRFVPVGADGRPAGDWKVVQGLTNTRSMAINGLVPGTTYMVQVRALSVILETMVPTEAAAIIRLVQSLSAPLHVTFEETTQAEWLWNARI